MTNKEIQLKRNYSLYSDKFDAKDHDGNKINYINSSTLSNKSFPSDRKLYRINNTSSSYCPHDSYNSNNGGTGVENNQDIFQDQVYMNRSVKYSRQWGMYLGNYGIPGANDKKAWLHGVKGIHFEYELEADTKYWCKPQDMWLTFCKYGDNKIYYAPLIQGGSKVSGILTKYSGHDYGNLTQSLWDSTGQGKFKGEWCAYMTGSDISWIEDNKAVLCGAWFNYKQIREANANKNFYLKIKKFVPMMQRDNLPDKNNSNSSKNYRVILPRTTYPFSDTQYGYMKLVSP